MAEEWEKRDELERLQQEQQLLLDEERIKRMEYEDKQRQKEEQLKCWLNKVCIKLMSSNVTYLIGAEERLAQLEKEREALDEELKQARQKMILSEGKKDFLEAKLYQYVPVLREGKLFIELIDVD